MHNLRKPTTVLLWLSAIVVTLGFWCHSSLEPDVIGKYSTTYLIGVSVATVCVISFVLTLSFLFRPSVEASRQRQRRIKRLVIALLVLAATLAELVTTSVQRSRLESQLAERREKLSEFHPFLQIAAPRNDSTLHTNRLGFRGDHIEPLKPAGTFRVFVLGGSTVYCSRVPYEQTHCFKLQQLLAEALPTLKVEVQNAGCDWHTTQHSVIKYQSLIQDFDADLIIVYHAINDICRSFIPPDYARGEFQPDYSHYSGSMSHIVNDYFLADTPSRIALVGLASRAFRDCWYSDFRVASKELQNAEWLRWHPREVTVAPESLPSLITFRRNLSDLVSHIQAKGTAVVLASQPHLYKPGMSPEETSKLIFPMYFCRSLSERASNRSVRLAMSGFNDTSRQVAKEHGVTFIELEAAVPKDIDHFVDDVHYTELGNSVVAKTLFAGLASEIPRDDHSQERD